MIALVCTALVLFYVIDINVESVNKSESQTQNIDKIEVEQPKANELSEQLDDSDPYIECANTVIFEHFNKLKPAKIISIKQMLRGLVQQGESEVVLDWLSVTSGLGLDRGRLLRLPSDDFAAIPAYDDANLVVPDLEYYNLLSIAEISGDITPIMKALEKSAFPTNAFYYSNSYRKPLSLFSFLLFISKRDDHSFIEQMIDADITISMADLAYLTQNNYSQEIIKQVYHASNVEVDTVLEYLGNKTSLTIIALENNKLDIASFWLSEGSPSQTDLYSYNAFDLLIEHYSDVETSSFKKFLKQLQQQKLLPTYHGNLLKLQSLVSTETFKNYQKAFNNKLSKLTQVEEDRINQLTEQVHDIVLDKLVSYETTSKPRHKCSWINGRLLASELMSGLLTDLLNFKMAVPKQKISFVQKTVTTGLAADIEQAKNIYDSPAEIIKHLSIDESLTSKQKVALYRLDVLKELGRKVSTITEENEEITATLTEIFQLARQGKWQQARSLLNQMNVVNEEALQTLMFIAISTNADFSFIVSLFKEGASIPENIIYHLIINNNTELTKNLLPYGLKLKFSNPLLFDSPLALAVENRALNMVNLLIEQGSTLSADFGYDALDRALQQINTAEYNFPYVATLLGAGAKIKASHREIVSQLKINNIELYFKLIGRYPQFLPS